MNAGREAFSQHINVSRETLEQLDIYADLLERWTKRINLVSTSTLADLWVRHFLDSAQLMPFVIDGHWVDMGSGGGFPGAVLAIMSPGVRFTLVESDQRKATFLRAVSRETGVRFYVIAKRIEDLPNFKADRLSSRALAPLFQLLEHADRHLAEGGRAIFMKGANHQSEIDEALESWRFDCETYPSKTDPEAVILSIGDIERV